MSTCKRCTHEPVWNLVNKVWLCPLWGLGTPVTCECLFGRIISATSFLSSHLQCGIEGGSRVGVWGCTVGGLANVISRLKVGSLMKEEGAPEPELLNTAGFWGEGGSPLPCTNWARSSRPTGQSFCGALPGILEEPNGKVSIPLQSITNACSIW